LIALGIAWGLSDLRLVLLPQYEKDSYRAASTLSMTRAKAHDSEILWAADPHTAYYYGLQVAMPRSLVDSRPSDLYSGVTWPIHGRALNAGNWTVDEATNYLLHRTAGVILVLSRPDLYDENGGWHALVEQQNPPVVARLSEFQIYEWPAAENAIAQLHSVNQQPPASSSGTSR
jgi:hypothetical protein